MNIIKYIRKISTDRLIITLRFRKKKVKIWFFSYIENCKLGEYSTIYYKNFLKNSSIGDFSYIASKSKIFNTKIWKFCSIWSNCQFWLGKHPTKDFVSTHPMFFSTKKQAQITLVEKDYFSEYEEIAIWNDVWVWNNVIILDWVKVWNWAIIWAWAVVTKDIPDYAIVGWIPAKIIKYRFSENEIQFLLKEKWWDKDIKWLKENFKIMQNINNLISIYYKENLNEES